MSIQFRRAISLGTSNTGLTSFKAWPRLRDGSAAEAAITLAVNTGYIEDGKGIYTIINLTLADSATRTIRWTKVDGTFLGVSNPDASAIDAMPGAAPIPPDPTDPDVVVGQLTNVKDGTGVACIAMFEFRSVITSLPDGESMPRREWSVTNTTPGVLAQEFRPLTPYEGRRDGGEWQPFTTPSSGSFLLPGILGSLGS